MVKKRRMGRNLDALLGGASRKRESEPAAAELVVDNDTAGTGAVTGTQSPADTADTTPAGNVSRTIDATRPPVQQSSAGPAIVPTELVGESKTGDKLRMLGVDQIRRGNYQPRRHFDQELLQELADSLAQQGMIQPILVRPHEGAYEIIAGERRWRAAQLAGIGEIPAIVRELDDQSVAAVSLIENIQRADLNPLEEARALQRLCEEFTMTHSAVAEAVGRSRAAVTNLIRLLDLHDDVKQMVDRGELEMGHARAMLSVPLADQPETARRIVKQRMTVRAVEKLARDLREGREPDAGRTHLSDPNIDALRQKLSDILGAQVAIKHQKSGAGKLEIRYASVDELEGILGHIK